MFWTMLEAILVPTSRTTAHEKACEVLRNLENFKTNNWVIRKLEDAGIDVLGSGCYGIVVDGGDCAIKYCYASDDSYRAFLDLCVAHESDYLPEIFWTEMVTDEILAVAMEKLSPLEIDYDEEDCEIIVNCDEYRLMRKVMRRNSNAIAQAHPELNALMDLMLQQRSGLEKFCDDIYISDDMHSGNAMLRGEHLVITDPWC